MIEAVLFLHAQDLAKGFDDNYPSNEDLLGKDWDKPPKAARDDDSGEFEGVLTVEDFLGKDWDKPKPLTEAKLREVARGVVAQANAPEKLTLSPLLRSLLARRLERDAQVEPDSNAAKLHRALTGAGDVPLTDEHRAVLAAADGPAHGELGNLEREIRTMRAGPEKRESEALHRELSAIVGKVGKVATKEPTREQAHAPVPTGHGGSLDHRAVIRTRRVQKLTEKEDGEIIKYDEPVPCDACGKKCTARVHHMTDGSQIGQECAGVIENLSERAAGLRRPLTEEEARHHGANDKHVQHLRKKGLVSPIVHVKPHMRTTEHGVVAVSGHDRVLKKAGRPMGGSMAGAMGGPMEGGEAEPEPTNAPLQRVKFRHPRTGEMTDGHIHAVGAKGALVEDGAGETHKVEHGNYLHHQDEDQTDHDKLVAAAKKHIALGPKAPLAVYGLAALMAAGGVDRAHELKVGDVVVRDEEADALIKPDKLRVTDSKVVAALRAQRLGKDPKDPLFQVDGAPIAPAALTEYVRRYGAAKGNATGNKPIGGSAPPADTGADTDTDPDSSPDTDTDPDETEDMTKASPNAMFVHLPQLGKAQRTWVESGWTCEYRQNDAGLGTLSMRKAGDRLAYHEVVGSLTMAYSAARDYAAKLGQGIIPMRGVFAVDQPTG